MDLELLQKELYKNISSTASNLYLGSLPPKDEDNKALDYLQKLYCTYDLNSIEDMIYKDSISLEVTIISDLRNKIEVQKKAMCIDKLLNNKWIDICNSKIIRSNIYFTSFDDLEDNKSLITLNYKIFRY